MAGLRGGLDGDKWSLIKDGNRGLKWGGSNAIKMLVPDICCEVDLEAMVDTPRRRLLSNNPQA